MTDEEVIDVDGMLAHAGDFSKYQIILTCLFSVINIFSAFHYFGQTFSSLIPEYVCNTSVYNQTDVVAGECSIKFFQNNIEYDERPCKTGWIYNDTNTLGYISIVQEVMYLKYLI